MFSIYDQPQVSLVVNDGIKMNDLAEQLRSGSTVLLQCRPETNRNDQVVFTNKCIIYADAKDLAGHNDAAEVIPYKAVRSFAVETASGLMGESVLRLDFKTGKSVTFTFKGKADVAALGKAIYTVILNG